VPTAGSQAGNHLQKLPSYALRMGQPSGQPQAAAVSIPRPVYRNFKGEIFLSNSSLVLPLPHANFPH